MRAFAFAWIASLALAACAPAPAPEAGAGRPLRVVSLNLCTDELLLLLASPDQIASITHLAQQEAETPLWRQARQHPANGGSMAEAAALRPTLILNMGGGGDRIGIARRLGIETLDLPYPQTIDDVVAAIRQVAAALQREEAGEALVGRIQALRRSAPEARADAVWIGGGGRTVAADGLEAQWMALAGLRQREVAGQQVSLDLLLAEPPEILLRSDYRSDQYSRGQAWLTHPLARAQTGSRTLATDGRRWTCMGPLLVAEIERLRGLTQ